MRAAELFFNYALRNFRHPVRRWRYAHKSRAPSAPSAPRSRALSILRLLLTFRVPPSQWIFAFAAEQQGAAHVLLLCRMAAGCGCMAADA